MTQKLAQVDLFLNQNLISISQHCQLSFVALSHNFIFKLEGDRVLNPISEKARLDIFTIFTDVNGHLLR
jgi:hypothetical protein